jgi:two-component system chemotaxis response regulator CheB
MAKKIRVLVVDDSLVFREVISRGISSDPDIEVVAKADSPTTAIEKIMECRPDVMTCDIQMPEMNGIEFVKRLLPRYPLPVIVVSTISHAVFDAINAGAVDFVAKPDMGHVRSVEDFIYDMIAKIKIAALAKVPGQANEQPDIINAEKGLDNKKVIAIGSSTGGTEAVHYILKQLPPDIPGILVVQHIPPLFSAMFAERLNEQTRFKVKEAETGDYVEQGRVLIAPGDKHMKVKKIGSKYKLEVFEGEKVNGHCPSVDILFESTANEVGKDAIGVILTGMGNDGARGLFSMRLKGARTIGQDEQSCVVYGMPKVAYEIGAVEKQAPLSSIPRLIMSYLK